MRFLIAGLIVAACFLLAYTLMRTEHFVSEALMQDSVGRVVRSRNDEDLINGCRVNYVRQVPTNVTVQGAFENYGISMNDLNPGL